MPAPLLPAALSALACYGAALLLTLVLAARLTPAAWWRRPNARALAVLALGTGLLGSAGWWFAAPSAGAAADATAFTRHEQALKSLPGRSYRVADALNLRAATGVGAARLAVLPAGSTVTATGARDGDWWQVRAELGGAPYEGWASSLWLRRIGEGEGR